MYKILFFALLLSSSAIADVSWQYERELFQKVEHDLKRGVRASYFKSRKTLQDYPLYPYLVYQDMKRRISKVPDEQVIAFLERYNDSAITDHLRYRWLRNRAKRGRWETVAEHYIESPYLLDKEMLCLYAQALIKGDTPEQANPLIIELWLVDFSQNAACDPVFVYARREGVIGDEQIWQRILLVIAKRRIGLANYLARHLSKERKADYRRLKQAYHNPSRTFLQIKTKQLDSPYYRDILLYAFKREQRRNSQRILEIWERLSPQLDKYPQFQNDVQRSLGLISARYLEADTAYRYLAKLPVTAHTTESQFWLIRSALRLQNWHAVLYEIGRLDETLQTYPQWQYWKARALEQTNRPQRARQIWQALAQRGGYYGYLSADRVNAVYRMTSTMPTYTEDALQELESIPAVQRIREFILLKRPFAARREMKHLVTVLTPQLRMQLAVLCDRWEWSGGVIQALASEDFRGETYMRFPTPFRNLVVKEAKRNKLPEHWLYGVMRRESAFVAQIKSPVGALGLMQLMPRTARSVARRLGLRKPSRTRLLGPSLNVRLGTAYLKQVYKRNKQHLPLGLAAYNAGQTRVRQWLRRTPVDDAQIWVDTIPFDETRLYVRAVLFYMTVYQYKLQGRADRLSTLLSI